MGGPAIPGVSCVVQLDQSEHQLAAATLQRWLVCVLLVPVVSSCWWVLSLLGAHHAVVHSGSHVLSMSSWTLLAAGPAEPYHWSGCCPAACVNRQGVGSPAVPGACSVDATQTATTVRLPQLCRGCWCVLSWCPLTNSSCLCALYWASVVVVHSGCLVCCLRPAGYCPAGPAKPYDCSGCSRATCLGKASKERPPALQETCATRNSYSPPAARCCCDLQHLLVCVVLLLATCEPIIRCVLWCLCAVVAWLDVAPAKPYQRSGCCNAACWPC